MRIDAQALETTLNYVLSEGTTARHRKFIFYGEPDGPVQVTLVPIGCTVLRETSFN